MVPRNSLLCDPGSEVRPLGGEQDVKGGDNR